MILFSVSVPNSLRVYKIFATRLTNRENHEDRSTYHYSLAIKRLALSAIVISLGLMFSVFVYVPFGHQFTAYVHRKLNTQLELSETVEATKNAVSMGIWKSLTGGAEASIGTTRLQNVVYAYTIMFGLPYAMRFL